MRVACFVILLGGSDVGAVRLAPTGSIAFCSLWLWATSMRRLGRRRDMAGMPPSRSMRPLSWRFCSRTLHPSKLTFCHFVSASLRCSLPPGKKITAPRTTIGFCSLGIMLGAGLSYVPRPGLLRAPRSLPLDTRELCASADAVGRCAEQDWILPCMTRV